MAGFQEEIQFEVLRRLHQTPQVSQRALAKDLGVGLGTINFCFQALVEKGLVKMQNFSQSKNKLRYAYLLTPAGVVEKSKLTAEFLKRGYEAQGDFGTLPPCRFTISKRGQRGLARSPEQ